jgi:hypothetical protein
MEPERDAISTIDLSGIVLKSADRVPEASGQNEVRPARKARDELAAKLVEFELPFQGKKCKFACNIDPVPKISQRIDLVAKDWN